MIFSIIGLLFIFVIPGFLITQILLHDREIIEKILFSVIFSICFSIAAGLLLGFNEFMYKLTGGLKNLWFVYAVVNIGLFGFLVYTKNSKLKKSSFKN